MAENIGFLLDSLNLAIPRRFENQPSPAEQEAYATDRRPRAEPKHIRDREQIQRTGEDANTG
jgi:hypothetical protein